MHVHADTMKRRVASQLEDLVHMFATLKAAIKVIMAFNCLPLLELANVF